MPISEALLRRRQLDLDKRTVDLQNYFECLAAKHYSGLLPLWQRMDKGLKQKIKKLYAEMGALQDPAKLKTLAGKLKRLEDYQEQIQADIERVTVGTDAYMTGAIKGQFERAYYMNGWAVEQAAKVTATIPVLSPAQILGVMANPWLPDGANYSARIRANTQILAQEMQKVVKKAVTEGLGWNETARLISARTGESYFRAVALARTELNRSAALGASYSYMQNNDILDGKRWNATLDSRTAAKDAANDGQTYDLDYDTPENPGVPGQRIPNHVNCRCIWSPILSALGINNRERIARGDGDTPTKFGERTYIQAGTYREYAKQRGLPDLDDRLLNDNLRKYVRPGETLADLKRVVKRITINGNSITIPKPDWLTDTEINTTAPILSSSLINDTIPKLVVDLKDMTENYSRLGTLTKADRKAHAKELLKMCGLKKMSVDVKYIKDRGYCVLDYRSSKVMNVSDYTLQENDNRSDIYKIKTAFHELFHATSDGIEQDILTSGYSFTQWVDIEETFTECSAHYLVKQVGITDLQPSYSKKLVNNLPVLKSLPMFDKCQTIDDFGEVMVKYRMINKKPSNWESFIDVTIKAKDPVQYVLDNYKDYIDDNFDILFDKVVENSPDIRKNYNDFRDQARRAWEDVSNYRYLPAGVNAQQFFYDLSAAAMRKLGVK